MKNYKALLNQITGIHEQLQQQAVNSVNQSLTIRNWLIGYYIVEFEQNGNDRAKYGAKLLPSLAKELKNIKGIDLRALHNFKLFYRLYPQIKSYLGGNSIVGSLTPQLRIGKIESNLNLQNKKRGAPTHEIEKSKLGSLTPKYKNDMKNRVSGEHIITKLSYTHLELLIKINMI